MNRAAPQKKARGELASKTARKPITCAHYAVLTGLATVVGAAFWFVEQRRGRLADELERRRT